MEYESRKVNFFNNIFYKTSIPLNQCDEIVYFFIGDFDHANKRQ